jgi:hypothetical protein
MEFNVAKFGTNRAGNSVGLSVDDGDGLGPCACPGAGFWPGCGFGVAAGATAWLKDTK